MRRQQQHKRKRQDAAEQGQKQQQQQEEHEVVQAKHEARQQAEQARASEHTTHPGGTERATSHASGRRDAEHAPSSEPHLPTEPPQPSVHRHSVQQAEAEGGAGAGAGACKAEVAEVSAQVSTLRKRMDEADQLIAQLLAEIKQLQQKSQDNAEVSLRPLSLSLRFEASADRCTLGSAHTRIAHLEY